MTEFSDIKQGAAQQKRHWTRLTRSCNQQCLFCHDKENQPGGHVSLDEVLADLHRGIQDGCVRAILSGGEPTLHPDLLKIIREARGMGYRHVQMITNGRMLCYTDLIQELKHAGLDEVTLSLHSHRQEVFERLTGVPGSYHQAMKGLMNALSLKFIVSVDVVINRLNYRDLAATLKFFMGLGVTEFDLLHLVPFGEAWEARQQLFYSLDEAKPYLDQAFELARRHRIVLWTNRLPAMYLEGYEDLIQDPCKMADEINGRGFELERLIQTGEPLSCYGEACCYCFIRDFCRDLMQLRHEKILSASAPPPCLGPASAPAARPVFSFRKNMSINRFLDFFIRYRYCAKSLRCRECCFDVSCSGALVQDIRIRGFKILQPVST